MRHARWLILAALAAAVVTSCALYPQRAYSILWLSTWGNNTAWLESLAVAALVTFVKRDAIGRRAAAYWSRHHGPHAIAQHREALRQHEAAKRDERS